jgi:anhydro-N-acetylmuramic acid kinase
MALPYHFRPPPKSLGGEWIESEFWPVLKSFEKDNASDAHDLLATATAYIASQIRLAVQGKKTLVTGGGVYNTELLELLKGPSGAAITGGHVQVELPESDVIEGKEAHAFGFLGLLRALGKDNVWNSVTGAAVDHMGGALWGNFSKRGA